MIASAVGELSGYNLFAFCFNNPANCADPTGNWPKWIETAGKVVSAVVLVAAVVVTVVAVSVATAGTGSAPAVYGASILLGAALAGINGAVANHSKGNSYVNGYIGGLTGGAVQAAASPLPGGNVWGGALGAAKGTGTTLILNNIDPDSSNSSLGQIVKEVSLTAGKAAATGAITQYMCDAVDAGVSSQPNSLLPDFTFGFGEALKAFFGWADDAFVYLWE